jgi:3-oxoacyl-[acyl-carrier protein] reductase
LSDPIRHSDNAGSSGVDTLDGATVVVTGSSSGIGKAIALEFAAAGANVVVHARSSRDAAMNVASKVRSLGREAEVLLFDLADPTNHEKFVDAAWQWRRRVDVWVNNAGADVVTGEAARMSFAQKLELLWRVDVSATIHLSRIVGQLMKQQGSGVILNMGWDQAEQGMGGDSGEMFGPTKGAVMAFTRSLAQSLAPEVRVHCLAPGWIKTAWGEHASQYWQERARRESLLNRWGQPEDVARVALFAASPAAGFMTGHIFPVNGGFRYGVESRGTSPSGRGGREPPGEGASLG